MNDGKKRTFEVFGEQTVRRPGAGAADAGGAALENPYWLAEEPAPHPNPELGCVRRGHCCRSSPGWFGPGEAERAARLVGLEPDAFVRRYLVIDGIEVEGRRVEVFAPVKLDRFGEPALPPASRVDELYRTLRGVCIFFEGDGCGIYEARPVECRSYLCTHAPEQNLSHAAIARLWLG